MSIPLYMYMYMYWYLPEDKSCCLDQLMLSHFSFREGVPYTGRVLNQRTYKSSVHLGFELRQSDQQVSLQEALSFVGLCTQYWSSKWQWRSDLEVMPRYLSASSFKITSKQGCKSDKVSVPIDAELDLTFLGVTLHWPYFRPDDQVVRVLLEHYGAVLGLTCTKVVNGVISKHGLGWSLL